MLMVRELNSMMPVEGGYYHWIKQAFGPFSGFMAGWMNWVMSLVDVAIYPVLAAYYLGYFIPALRNGITLGGLELSGGFMSFLVAAVIIWAISALQVRGARLAGLTTSWLGVLMMAPLVVMTVLGIYRLDPQRHDASLPFLPEGRDAGRRLQRRAVRRDVELHGLGAADRGRRRDRQPAQDLPAGHAAGPDRRHRHLRPADASPACTAAAARTDATRLWGIEEYGDGEGIGVGRWRNTGSTPEQYRRPGAWTRPAPSAGSSPTSARPSPPS